MKKLQVCDKWELPLLEGEANALPGGAKGYYEYINGRMAETGRNALCIEWLLGRLPKGGSLVEPFGGVGVFATVAQNVLELREHLIGEIDKDCLAQLRRAFRNKQGVTVSNSDAKLLLMKARADYFLLDFSFMTIKRWDEWETQWLCLFDKLPKAVVWMDGAARYLHLHRKNYSEEFGCKVETPQDYTKAMSGFITRRYDYAITACAWSQGCFYFLAEPGPVRDIDFYHVSSGAEGLKLL